MPDPSHDNGNATVVTNGRGNGHGGGGGGGARPPRPVVSGAWWPYPLIWAVPILVIFGGSIYYRQYFQTRGRVITISFADVAGVKTGETPITVRGVKIGTVEAVGLSPDNNRAEVTVRLIRSDAGFARGGSTFWMVRPDISGAERDRGSAQSSPARSSTRFRATATSRNISSAETGRRSCWATASASYCTPAASSACSFSRPSYSAGWRSEPSKTFA